MHQGQSIGNNGQYEGIGQIQGRAEVNPAIRGVYIRTNMIRSRYTSGINTCRRRRHCYPRHHRHRKTREGVDYGAGGPRGREETGSYVWCGSA